MVIGSLNQLWAVGALISLVVVIYLGIMIFQSEENKKVNTGSTQASAGTGEFSAYKPPPPPPGKEVVPSGQEGGSND